MRKSLHAGTHSDTYTEMLANSKGLKMYSFAMCGEYCCIPSTQYAQHITLLICLTLSLRVFPLCPLLLHHHLPSLPSSSSPFFLFPSLLSRSPPPVETVNLSLFILSFFLPVLFSSWICLPYLRLLLTQLLSPHLWHYLIYLFWL